MYHTIYSPRSIPQKLCHDFPGINCIREKSRSICDLDKESDEDNTVDGYVQWKYKYGMNWFCADEIDRWVDSHVSFSDFIQYAEEMNQEPGRLWDSEQYYTPPYN